MNGPHWHLVVNHLPYHPDNWFINNGWWVST